MLHKCPCKVHRVNEYYKQLFPNNVLVASLTIKNFRGLQDFWEFLFIHEKSQSIRFRIAKPDRKTVRVQNTFKYIKINKWQS